MKIDTVEPLQHKALLDYLQSRGIAKNAAPFVKEAYYSIDGRDTQYFALAFPNDKGGLELRSQYFKGGTSPKYISTIEGKRKNQLNVFEGFMDFLSAWQYFELTT